MSMQALVINGPGKVAVETRPIPKIQHEHDVLVKVELAGLCGSDNHIYRGVEPIADDEWGFIMGHELIGSVVEIGTGVQNFKKGDRVVSPFTISCDDCYFCKRQKTSRCASSRLFGSPALQGVQAEYALVPLGESTLFKAPSDLDSELLLLMGDIWPTGFMVARNAFKLLDEPKTAESVAVVVGLGPVGLCAVTAAKQFFGTVYATDPVEERRKQAEKHGAIALPEAELRSAVKKATDGRGADAVMEVVGLPVALNLAIDLIRPWGVVSSCGVYNHHLDLNGTTLYDKNIRMQFGRAPVKALFPEALEVLRANQDVFKGFIQHKVPLSQAPEYYDKFNRNAIQKTAFIP